VLSHGAKIIFYGAMASAMTAGDWSIALIAAPFAIIGTNVGYRILQRLTDDNFRKWTRWIVTGIGMFYLSRGMLVLAGL
jgi:uncharacterized membrane protein YfcA